MKGPERPLRHQRELFIQTGPDLISHELPSPESEGEKHRGCEGNWVGSGLSSQVFIRGETHLLSAAGVGGRKGGGAKEEWFGCGRGVWWGSLGSRIQTEGFISSVTGIAQRLPRTKCCSWEMGRACASDHDGMRWRGKG